MAVREYRLSLSLSLSLEIRAELRWTFWTTTKENQDDEEDRV
jgi:hypothetical protein